MWMQYSTVIRKILDYWYVWLVPTLGIILCAILAIQVQQLPRRLAVPGSQYSVSVPAGVTWRVEQSSDHAMLALQDRDADIHIMLDPSRHSTRYASRAYTVQASHDAKPLIHSAPVVINGHKVLIQVRSHRNNPARYTPLVDQLVASLRDESVH